MKPSYLLLFLLINYCVYSQSSKSCATAPVVEFDLNSISKCGNRKETKPNKANKVTSVSNRRSSAHYVRKSKPKKELATSHTLDSKNEVSLEFKKIEISKIKTTNEILFNLVDVAPSFPKSDCAGDIKCFNNDIKNHFLKNFYPERASDNGINGKVFIQFTVDTKGNLTNLVVKGPKNATRLNHEVERVLSKMPRLSPGKHKSIPVNVKYALPINFSAD